MSIERASTSGQSQFLLSQVQTASLQLGKTQAQVASGKVSTDYAGLGDKVAMILASGVIIQLQDGENYVAVWPKGNSEKAPMLPYKGW